MTDICSLLEEDNLLSRAGRIGKCADELRRFVLEAIEHLVQIFIAQRLQKPFSRRNFRQHSAAYHSLRDEKVHVWAR